MQGPTKDLGTLIAHFMADIQDWEKAAKKMEQDIRRVEKSTDDATNKMNAAFERTGRRMEAVGKQMTKYVSLPLVGIGAAAFKMGKDFEAEMQKIVGLVGVAQDQVDDWSKDLIKMAPEMGKTPRELADALFFVTSAGFRGAEALDVLEMSAKASAAGLGETKVVADLVTSAINAYGIENLDAAMATDTLVAAVREGKAEAPALAASMGKVLPIASEMGVSFDQVGAATAAMTRTGTDAATAATQLRSIMVSILKPTDQAEEALGEMGTSSKELRDMLAGEEGLVGTLAHLREITDGNSEALAEVFPNVRALAGVLDIMGANAEENAQIFERMRDNTGALDHAFAAAADTVEFRWNRALGAGQSALVEVGRALEVVVIPMLDRAASALESFTEWFGNLNDGTRTLIVTFGALLAATGPVLMAMGTFTRVVLPMMTGQILATRAAMLRLNAAMMANPYVAAAAAIALVVAALVRVVRQAQRANELIRETLDMQATGTQDELLQVNQAITEQVKKLETARAYYNEIGRTLPWMRNRLREQIKEHEGILTQLALQRSEVIRLNRVQQEGLGTQLDRLRLERDALVDKQELTEEEEKRLKILNEQISALEEQRTIRRNMREEEEEANETLSAQLAKHTANFQKMMDVSEEITSESWDQIILEIRKSQELERQIALRQRLAQLMASGVGEQETTPQAGAAAARDEEGQLITPPDPGMFDGFNAALERTRMNAKDSFVDIGSSAGALSDSVDIASKRMTEGWDTFMETLMGTTIDLDHTVTQAFHNILSAGDASLRELAKITANTARQIIGAEIAKGIAAAVSSALQNTPFPLSIVAAAGAGAAAAALFSRIVPEFHTGGEVPGTGETLAVLMGGEYVLTEKQKEALQAGKPLDQATPLTYTLGQDKLVSDSVRTSTAMTDVFRSESDRVSDSVQSRETLASRDKVSSLESLDKVSSLESLVHSSNTSTSETISGFLDKMSSFENKVETAFASSSKLETSEINSQIEAVKEKAQTNTASLSTMADSLVTSISDSAASDRFVKESRTVETVTAAMPAPGLLKSDLTLPDLTLPDLTGPDMAVPDLPSPKLEDLGVKFSVPEASLPEVAAGAFEIGVLDFARPSLTVPDLGMAKAAGIPSMSVENPGSMGLDSPDLSLPGLRVPEVDVPDVGVLAPELSGTSITVPDVGWPEYDAPSLTAPALPDLPSLMAPDLHSLMAPDLPDLPSLQAQAPDLPGLQAPIFKALGMTVPDLPGLMTSVISLPQAPSLEPPVSDLKVPEADIPSAATPGLSLPNLTVPIPVMPDWTLPEVMLPGISNPEVEGSPVPGMTMPDVQVAMPSFPEMEGPGMALSNLSIPVPSMPGLPTPDLTLTGLPDLPDIAFAGVFHQGGIISGTGEQLALVKGGEGVFTPQQMAAMGTGGKINVAFRIPLEMNGRTVWEASRTYELDLGID